MSLFFFCGDPARWDARDGEGAHSAPVLGVHVGQWHLRPAPPAHAEHRGAAGVPGTHAEDGRHQVWSAHHLGGESGLAGFFDICFLIDCK